MSPFLRRSFFMSPFLCPARWDRITKVPFHDPGRASLTASHGAIRLGRSLALPELRKAVSEPSNGTPAHREAPKGRSCRPARRGTAATWQARGRRRGQVESAAARDAIAQKIESLDDAVAFIKQRFGIEMSKPHFSAFKSQIKKREAAGGSAAPKARQGRKPKAAVEGHLELLLAER
jgi:hypothetical protein